MILKCFYFTEIFEKNTIKINAKIYYYTISSCIT